MKRTSEKSRVVKLFVVVCLLAGLGLAARAQSTNLTALLQEGLFAEQGDHDMATAIADYQMLAAQYDKDRQLAATAVFRLGECYRAQNQTNEAVAQYQRVLHDFADQKVLATMSEQNLKGLGVGVETGSHFQQRLQAIVKRAGTDEANASEAPNPELAHELEMVNKVQGMKFEDIIQQAPTLVPDATLNNLINQYNQSVLDLLRLGTDYGPDSDQMKKAEFIRDGLREKITERLEGLKQALTTALAGGGGYGAAVRAPGNTSVGPAAEMDAVRNDLVKLKAHYDEISNLDTQQARVLVQQDYPNPVMTGLMQQLLDAQQKLVVLRNDYAETNVVIVRAKTMLDTINRQIDEQVAAVKELLKGKIQMDDQELSRLQELADKTGAESATPPVANEEDQEIQRIQDLVRNSPDLINAPGGTGNTPLSKAAANGWLKVAGYLLDHGAQVDQPGISPLIAAANAGNRAMVEFLLSRGADVNVTDSSGKTALQTAVEKKFKSVVGVLLTNRADVNLAGSKEKQSPIILAAGGPPGIVQMLLAAGARVDVENVYGDRALGEAIAVGFPETVQMLLAAKADVNTVNGNGILPLCLAAERRDANIVQMLLAAGANVDEQDKSGHTALSYAAKRGAEDIIKVLLSAKANPNDDSSDEPLLAAIGSKDIGSAELLLAAGADPDKSGSFDQQGHFNVDFQSHPTHMTPLWLAIYLNQLPMVQVLLKHGAHPDDTSIDGRSLVFRATVYPKVLAALLDGGANANAWDETGRYSFSPHTTVLQQLTCNGNTEVVQILLGHGADPNLRDGDGETALQMAIRRAKDAKIVQLLLEHGADPNVRDNYGKTPLVAAKESNDKALGGEIFELLHQHGALDKLPDRDRITLSRAANGFWQPIFYKGTNDWNHFTMMELLGNAFGLLSVDRAGDWKTVNRTDVGFWNTSAIRFPDLNHVAICRPSADGSRWSTNVVDVDALLSATNGSNDMVLQWGDVVEIPEADHTVEAVWSGPPEVGSLVNVLSNQCNIIVKGENTTFTLAPEYELQLNVHGAYGRPVIAGVVPSFMLRSVLDRSKLLRSSSDLTRVKVTRRDPKTGEPQDWVLDCSGDITPAFWVRGGDVIEVPEKP